MSASNCVYYYLKREHRVINISVYYPDPWPRVHVCTPRMAFPLYMQPKIILLLCLSLTNIRVLQREATVGVMGIMLNMLYCLNNQCLQVQAQHELNNFLTLRSNVVGNVALNEV